MGIYGTRIYTPDLAHGDRAHWGQAFSGGFVFTDGAFQAIAVADIAAHHLHSLEEAGAYEFTLRHPVAHQADHVGAGLVQAASEPGAH